MLVVCIHAALYCIWTSETGVFMPLRLRSRLADGSTTYGLWVTLESATITEVAATMELDWVCVDLEHGHLGYRELIDHCRAARGSETAVLARVPIIAQDTIKRVLDIGVDGILLPLVHDHTEVEQGVRYAKYPPDGTRGIGGERAVRWGLEFDSYLARANNDLLVIPLVETAGAVEHIDEIVGDPAVDAIFFGPADLSASYGHVGSWEGPGIADLILDIQAKAQAQGKRSGILARSTDDLAQRTRQEFGMVGLGSDAGLLIRQITEMLSAGDPAAVATRWF